MSDMKREYVVEKYVQGLGTSLIADMWVSIHTTDDQDDAVRVCKEENTKVPGKYRVRQFWLHSEPPKQRPLKDGETPRVDAPLHDVVCLEHPNEKLRVYDLGVPVSCPVCRARMVPADFAAGLGEAEDL